MAATRGAVEGVPPNFAYAGGRLPRPFPTLPTVLFDVDSQCPRCLPRRFTKLAREITIRSGCCLSFCDSCFDGAFDGAGP
jgi:hypothetical protein